MRNYLLCALVVLNSCGFSSTDQGDRQLFDGKSLSGWHVYNEDHQASIWYVENGVLTCDPVHDGVYGDLVTDQTFDGDFTFSCEWRVGRGGNSGIFVHVLESDNYAAPWMSAVEYQILDHADTVNHNYQDPKRMSGALYGFQAIPEQVPYIQDGWNKTLIEVKGDLLTYFLNGAQTAAIDLSSASWKTQVEGSKFSEYPDFGKARTGAISLQAWKGRVQFRNLTIYR